MNSDSPNETGVLADDNFKFEDILFFRLFIQIFFFGNHCHEVQCIIMLGAKVRTTPMFPIHKVGTRRDQ